MDLDGIPGALSKKAQAGSREKKATRWAKKRHRQFGSKADFVRARPCIGAGRVWDPCEGPIQACHGVALSHDPNSGEMFAGCARHHEMSDGRRVIPGAAPGEREWCGRGAFERVFGVSIKNECEALTRDWLAWCEKNGVDPAARKDRKKARVLIGEQGRAKAHAATDAQTYEVVLENVQACLHGLEGERTELAHALRMKFRDCERMLRRGLGTTKNRKTGS